MRTLSIAFDLLLQLEAGAAFEDLFGGAFADQPVHSLRRLHNDGHEPPREVERQLVHFVPVGDRDLAVHLVMCEHRTIEYVLEARLEVAVQVREREHPIIFLPGDVTVPFEDDAVLRQGPRLVRAEHVHGAEILNRIQALHDDLLSGHEERAAREGH